MSDELSFIGAGESDTPGDLSERADEYLAEIYTADYERQQKEFAEYVAAKERSGKRRRAAG